MMAEIFYKMADLLWFFAFYVNNLTLWTNMHIGSVYYTKAYVFLYLVNLCGR